MDIKILRFTYLNYFKNQLDKNEPIDTKVLMDMAQNINSAAEVIKELKNEGLIEGISIIENDPNHVLIQSNHEVKLTEKGIKYLESKDNNTDKVKENLTYEQFMSNEVERINKLSSDDKKSEIQNKILLEYYRINNGLPMYDDNIIIESELKQTIKSIVKQYYPSTPQIVAKQLTKELCAQGYSSYIYSKNEDNKIHIEDLLTTKGKERIDKVYGKSLNKTLGELSIEEFYNLYGKLPILNLANIKISPIFKELNQKINSLYGSNLKKIQQVLNNYPLKDNQQIKELQNYIQHINNAPLAKEYYNIQKQIGNIQQSPELQKIQKSLSELIKEPSSNLYKELTKNSKSNKESESETYTFEGILGQNCGDYIYIDDKNTDDRLPERIINEKTGKHFIVKNGIKVLRGFAKASDLYNASEPDKKNYQRNEDFQHLQEIKTFLSEINPSGKYLPELTFVARGGYELIRPEWGNNLKTTNLGHFKNLDYYQLNLNGTKLYRIDGNHRLEALKKLSDENKEYYIPFAIILMGKQILFDNTDKLESSIGLEYSGNYGLSDDAEEKKITDMEAFLFYFLNAKAKKLTTEENLKGLVNSTSWGNHELMVANKYLPLLQYLEKEIKTNNFLNSYFCNNEPIKNIAEILEKINDDINLEQFKVILSLTNELLIFDKWNDLKQFRFYCQLVFYIAYKNPDKNICLSILNNINNWVKKYKFDNTTFDNPIMLYHSAEKTNNISPIKVFVAMPYYDDEIIEDVNDQLKKLSEELIKKYPLLKNRLEIYEVMKHRGYEIDIQEQIIEQIKTANIFIADISEHICKKGTKKVDSHANPNVMYELGLAKGQTHTEIILLKNKKDKIEVPSDIITKYHNKFEFDKKVSMRKKLFEAIENILKEKFEII